MTRTRRPVLIQGGMGIAVSSWQLAREVSRLGQLGVVSGTALDGVVARRLQDGDEGGHIRRALRHFPSPAMADRILSAYFLPEGRQGKPYRPHPTMSIDPGRNAIELAVIGNFVEVKSSTLAAGAKANHLAYLGDATVGERVNYGAGSITANYDGANKHRTVIEADVHVGSNCVLVAPVTIGAGGTVGGGSTITKSTPAGALSVARGKQVSIANWARPVKKK